MANRFIDSCGDAYGTAQITRKWTSVTSGVVIAAGGRRGTNGLSFLNGIVYSLTLDNQATWTVGFCLRMAANSSYFTAPMALLNFMDSTTTQLRLVIVDTAGHLAVQRGTTTLATSTNIIPAASAADYYIEFRGKIDPTVGEYEVRVNGSSTGWIPAATGANTRSSTNSFANTIQFGNPQMNGSNVLDDIYINDGTGSVNNGFLGDMRVDAYMPNGDGANTALTTSTGTTHNTLVNEATANDDTNYVESSTVGNKDTYAIADITHAPNIIAAVQVNMVVKKDDAGARSICSVARSGGADYDGAAQVLSTSYLNYKQTIETDPNTGAAWTKTGFNAAEFGMKVQA